MLCGIKAKRDQTDLSEAHACYNMLFRGLMWPQVLIEFWS